MIPTGLSLTDCDGNCDGCSTFDLTQLDAQVLQGISGYRMIYHENQGDTNVNTIPSRYNNIALSVQTI
ncbi:MAG: hypothetical protein HRT67_04900 [Flavobacteriaceae bacterium]|nr:hypothetical protein [Flavobacteriaceae bacterium]